MSANHTENKNQAPPPGAGAGGLLEQPEPDPGADPWGGDLGPGGWPRDEDGDGPARPIVWAALSSDDLEWEWLALNEWVEDLRRLFSIPPNVIPPYWHRHPQLREHLSALRSHWLGAYDPAQHASAPFGWIRDLDEWQLRMREAVAQAGTGIARDRPHRLALWPGEPAPDPADEPPPVNLLDRYDDFLAYVEWHVGRRRDLEDHYQEMLDQAEAIRRGSR
ncbi:MAG: hypothetical protein LBK95_03570 [Bifidobacteriaceae bacterium]|jgi:hypothetical protein|nr:hypothetical protein [Bifidobacteriaceae bacterium]